MQVRNFFKKIISRESLLIFLATICIIATSYVIYLFYLNNVINSTRPPLFGSDRHIIDYLKENEHGDSYKFLVLGDSRGNYPVEEELINPVAKEIDFALILGDAADSTYSSHKYLNQTMRRLDLKVPFFYVPGNNDFGRRIKRDYLNAFTRDDFEKAYGPLNFSFVYHNDLYIALCSVGDKKCTEESLNFLNTFKNQRSHYRHCFVFMHIPPLLSVDDDSKFGADERYVKLFEKLKVNFVFASHYHGYQEIWLNGIDYIITGGAGANLDGKTIKQFYHSIEFTIKPDSISRRFIYSPGDIDLLNWLELRSTFHVIPFFTTHYILMYILLGCLIISWVGLLFFLYSVIRIQRVKKVNL